MDPTPTDSASAVRLRLGPGRVEGDVAYAALIERARSGDLQAWSRLYQETFDAMLRHLCYLTGDACLAEDLLQDSYTRAMAHIVQYDGRSSFIAWLRGIGLNVARMHWRRARTGDRVHERVRELVELTSDSAGFSVERIHQQSRRMELLYAVLATLPENLREAFVLRELEGLPPAEVAAQLGISEGNVAVRASRARARIRAELERQGWVDGSPS